MSGSLRVVPVIYAWVWRRNLNSQEFRFPWRKLLKRCRSSATIGHERLAADLAAFAAGVPVAVSDLGTLACYAAVL